MAKPVYKLLLLLKRNPDLSVEAFEELYETEHAPFCAPLLKGACRYQRRYTTLVGAPHVEPSDLEFDVITELWFDDRAAFEGCAERMSQHKLPSEVLPREARMFDLAKIRIVSVVEYDSDLGPVAADARAAV
jgi:hypothetical protein